MHESLSPDDLQAIEALIGSHFDPMRWDAHSRPDWARFRQDFHPAAVLVPAARPAQARTLAAFVERMESVAAGSLRSFEEWTLGMQVMGFGNVAVVLSAFEMLENAAERNQDVSAYLLVKSEGRWTIAAHAWDHASAERPLPPALLGSGQG